MLLRALRVMAICFFGAALQVGAFAQSDAPTKEAAPEPTAKERPAATQAELDARGKEVHDQLASVTNGVERTKGKRSRSAMRRS